MGNENIKDKEQRFMSVVSRMKDFTKDSLSPICGAFSEDSCEHVGSGTIIQLRGRPYLLTAQHVAIELKALKPDGERKFPLGLCHFLGDGEQMLWTGPSWYTWPIPHDIAISPIDPAEIANSTVTPLAAHKFALNTQDLGDDLYFFQGFPGKASYPTTFGGPGVVSRSQPYGGFLTEEVTWGSFDKAIHLAVTYPASEIVDARGRSTTLLWPGGLSGSLLWKTNYLGSEASWQPDMATVVGLIHEFDQDAQCVIATRIEYVKGLCLFVLREEHAHRRWDERGRPEGDDWADWFDAEASVQTLI